MASAEPGTMLFDRYRVVRRIAAGGMGTVFEARDEVLDQPVALKRVSYAALPDELAAETRERTLREARNAAQMRGVADVVAIYDVQVSDDDVWLVLEYLPSRSLAELTAGRTTLDVRTVAGIGATVARGLAAAHSRGITHRDVKPGNILIATDGGAAKLTDFGISHAEGESTLTATGQVSGTPAYMAREVARGEDATPASDVFSLGATLYAAVEGIGPFGPQSNPRAMVYRVANDPVRPPEQAGALAPVLMAMMADEPARRPDATTLAGWLDTIAVRPGDGRSPGPAAGAPNPDPAGLAAGARPAGPSTPGSPSRGTPGVRAGSPAPGPRVGAPSGQHRHAAPAAHAAGPPPGRAPAGRAGAPYPQAASPSPSPSGPPPSRTVGSPSPSPSPSPSSPSRNGPSTGEPSGTADGSAAQRTPSPSSEPVGSSAPAGSPSSHVTSQASSGTAARSGATATTALSARSAPPAPSTRSVPPTPPGSGRAADAGVAPDHGDGAGPRRRRTVAGVVAGVVALAVLAGAAVVGVRAMSDEQQAPPAPASPRAITGDPRAADPCALLDVDALGRFGTVTPSAGAPPSGCRADITASDGRPAQVTVSYSRGIAVDGGAQPVGDLTVQRGRTGTADGADARVCTHGIGLPDGNQVLLRAFSFTSGVAPCDLADAALDSAVASLQRDGVRYDPNRNPDVVLAHADACQALDASALGRVGIGAAPFPGFASWSCSWGTADNYASVSFGGTTRRTGIAGEQGPRIAGRESYVEAGQGSCSVTVVHREGPGRDDRLESVTTTVQVPGGDRDRTCGAATDLATTAESRLPVT